MRKPERAQENPKGRPENIQKCNPQFTSEKKKNKWKQRRKNSQHQSNVIISPGHEKEKEHSHQNRHKQRKNTAETRERKHVTKTATLFGIAKPMQTLKKRRKNCKHKIKIIFNGKRTQNQLKNPERASGRQNSTVRQAKRLPNKVPTGHQKISVSILKKNEPIRIF